MTHAHRVCVYASEWDSAMRVVGTDAVLLPHIYAAAGDAHEQAVPVAVIHLEHQWLPAFVLRVYATQR